MTANHNRLTRTGVLLFIAILLLITTYTVSGASSSNQVVLATGEFAPFTSEKMEGKGFCTEIVTAVFNEMGLEPKYEFYPWERCEKVVQSGDAWAAFPYTYTPERAQVYLYTDTIANSTTKFFYYKKRVNGETIKFTRLEDLKKYKIGGANGFFYKKAFEQAGLNVDWSPNEEGTIQKLVAGRIDLMPYAELVGWGYIKQYFPNEIKNFGVINKPINNGDLKLIVSKSYPNAPELINKFNKALKSIQQKGIYKQLLQKYNLQ